MIPISTMPMLFWLLVGHAVADYPLQGDFLARAKNHKQPIPGITWWQCLMWHSIMHGGAVALVTGSVGLGVAETCIHMLIDFGKCQGWYGFDLDQAFHVVCKIAWTVIITLQRGA